MIVNNKRAAFGKEALTAMWHHQVWIAQRFKMFVARLGREPRPNLDMASYKFSRRCVEGVFIWCCCVWSGGGQGVDILLYRQPGDTNREQKATSRYSWLPIPVSNALEDIQDSGRPMEVCAAVMQDRTTPQRNNKFARNILSALLPGYTSARFGPLVVEIGNKFKLKML